MVVFVGFGAYRGGKVVERGERAESMRQSDVSEGLTGGDDEKAEGFRHFFVVVVSYLHIRHELCQHGRVLGRFGQALHAHLNVTCRVLLCASVAGEKSNQSNNE